MTWPTYTPIGGLGVPPDAHGDPLWAPILRHTERQRGHTRGAPGQYGVSVDVWRDGAHLWRSYVPEPGWTPDAYADATLGADGPRNHDDGVWGVAGVDVADWPIPSRGGLTSGLSLTAISDLLYTLVAIALGRPSHDMGAAPPDTVLRQRLARADGAFIVAAFEIEDVSVRAMIAKCATPSESPDVRRWRATLARRDVRANTMDLTAGTLADGLSTVFDAPADAPMHIVSRHAKRAVGATGWPATRQGASMVWHLARAPYRLVIESVDGASAPGVS